MRVIVMACASWMALCTACAAGESHDGPMWGTPNVVPGDGERDDDGADEEGETDDGFEGTSGGFDDAGDSAEGDSPPADASTSGAQPADDGGAPPPADDGGAPPPADDGGAPPPPADDGGLPPPGDLTGQCELFCDGLQACGLMDDTAAAFDDCVSSCAIEETPACDAAWSDVMTCVNALDCFQMTLWNVALPGYPCEAQDAAYGNCG